MRFFPSVMASLLFFVVVGLACVELSTCLVVKGSVNCLDCTHHLSGATVAFKCNKGKKLAYALTDEKGFFQAELPLSPSSTSPSPNCLARLLGGPKKLCSFKKNLVSKIVKAKDHDAYTISTPLTTFSTCPPNHSSYASKTKDPKIADTRAYGKSGGENGEFKSSKTIDLPLPPEWGFPPTSYYTPFIPIIGIP